MNFIPTQSPPEHRLGYRQRAVLLSNPPKAHQHSLGINIYPPPPLKKKKNLTLEFEMGSVLPLFCAIKAILLTFSN